MLYALHRNALPQRLVRLLARSGPLHYRTLTRRLRHPNAHGVRMICQRLAHRGVLRWVDEGVYAVREEGTHGAL
jgi:hypothetical protein